MIPEHKEFAEWFDNRLDDEFTKDILKASNWFLEFMGETTWRERKENVIRYFSQMSKNIFEDKKDIGFSSNQGRMAFYDDWIAWYLYLAESLELRPMVGEPSQSARIWPFFSTIGKHIALLKLTTGIEFKLQELLIKKGNLPDSILFEFVVAICYLRNGWEVAFIPETGAHKTPDLHVKKKDREFFVECKRLAKGTLYSDKERTEWLKRWENALPYLTGYSKSVFLDVIFKKEVMETSEFIIADAIKELTSCKSTVQGSCLENKEIKVCARHIDMFKIHNHLKKWMVKYPSQQLNYLLDENYEPDGSYTSAYQIELVEVAPDKESVVNLFVKNIKKAYCAKWECIAEESIDKKARDVKNLLVKAVNQAPEKGSTVVHIGYETLHGPFVEFIRDNKIVELISSFDFGSKNIASVFCHSFQPKVLPDNEWEFAETTRYFGINSKPEDILEDNLLMQREHSVISNETHWMQDALEKVQD